MLGNRAQRPELLAEVARVGRLDVQERPILRPLEDGFVHGQLVGRVVHDLEQIRVVGAVEVERRAHESLAGRRLVPEVVPEREGNPVRDAAGEGGPNALGLHRADSASRFAGGAAAW